MYYNDTEKAKKNEGQLYSKIVQLNLYKWYVSYLSHRIIDSFPQILK